MNKSTPLIPRQRGRVAYRIIGYQKTAIIRENLRTKKLGVYYIVLKNHILPARIYIGNR